MKPPAAGRLSTPLAHHQLRVVRVPAATTYPLRQQVLRPHEPVEALALPGDDDPDTGTFAALTVDGAVVGTATVRPERCPWAPDRTDAWRLRGMATADRLRGHGIGALVLTAALAHVGMHDGGLVWCNARTGARRFYERAGFVVKGEEFNLPDIGPHVRMWREVRRTVD